MSLKGENMIGLLEIYSVEHTINYTNLNEDHIEQFIYKIEATNQKWKAQGKWWILLQYCES